MSERRKERMSDVGINLLLLVLLFLLFRSKVGDVGRSTSKRKSKSLTREHGSATH